MRVHTKITLQLTEDVSRYVLVSDEWYEYEGVIAEAKKGREGEGQVAKSQQALAASETPAFLGEVSPINNFLDEYTPSSPTSFSPAVQAQYDADMSNVRNTYSNLASSGFRQLGARGFGSAPTGAASSLTSSLGREEGQGETDAYRNAQVNNTNQGFRALAGRMGLMSQVDPNRALSGAGTSYANLNKMGSTLGDIGAGISSAAGIATGLGVHV